MNEDFRAHLDQLREQYARCEGRIDGLDSIGSQLVGAVERNEINHGHDERMDAVTESLAALARAMTTLTEHVDSLAGGMVGFDKGVERMATRHEEDVETHRQRMAAFDERLDRMAANRQADTQAHRQRIAVLDERLDRIAQLIETSLRRQGNGHQPQ